MGQVIETLAPFVKTNVKPGSVLVTDEHFGYKGLGKKYNHQTINHSLKIYVRGNVHTNTIEGFWNILKRGIYGTYHQISHKHTQRYLNEFSGRFNTRLVSDSDRFNGFLSRYQGRLTYNNLIGKK